MYNFQLKTYPEFAKPATTGLYTVDLTTLDSLPEAVRLMDITSRHGALFIIHMMARFESRYNAKLGYHRDPYGRPVTARGAFAISHPAEDESRRKFPKLPPYPRDVNKPALMKVDPAIQIRHAAAYSLICATHAMSRAESYAKLGWISPSRIDDRVKKMIIGIKGGFQIGPYDKDGILPSNTVAHKGINANVKEMMRDLDGEVEKFLHLSTLPDFYASVTPWGREVSGPYNYDNPYV